MPTTATAADAEASTQVSITQLTKSGVLAILTASGVNVLVLELALAVLAVPPAFTPLPLGWGPVVASSTVGAIGATVVYGIIARYSTRPNRTFTIIAAAVWVLSYANLLTPALAGAPTVIYAILGLMHVTAAITIVGALRRTANRSGDVTEDAQ